MKKIRLLFAALALVFCAALVTGCGSAADDLFSGTYDQWYKYNGTTTIPLSSADDDSSQTSTLKSVEVYCKFDPSSGLKVAIQASKAQNLEIFNGLATQTVNVTMGGTKDYTLEQFGSGKWSALYLTGKFEKSSTPKIVSSPSECILLDNFENYKIQWKKVLANFILNNLLGE